MRVVENLEVVNSDKTILGKKNAELTLDTETTEVSVSFPAMFGDPVVKLDDLVKVVDKLKQMQLDRL